MEQKNYFVGLELGQSQDHSALVVLERPTVTVSTPRSQRRPAMHLRHLHRFQIGTSYPDIVKSVVALLQTPPLREGSNLIVNQTCVGRSICDALVDALRGRVNCIADAVTITAGHAGTLTAGRCIPKKELVSVLQLLLQSRRLLIADSLPDAELFVRELQNFKAEITLAGTDPFEDWRGNARDDLVLAMALAAYWCEKSLPGLDDQPTPRLHRIVP